MPTLCRRWTGWPTGCCCSSSPPTESRLRHRGRTEPFARHVVRDRCLYRCRVERRDLGRSRRRTRGRNRGGCRRRCRSVRGHDSPGPSWASRASTADVRTGPDRRQSADRVLRGRRPAGTRPRGARLLGDAAGSPVPRVPALLHPHGRAARGVRYVGAHPHPCGGGRTGLRRRPADAGHHRAQPTRGAHRGPGRRGCAGRGRRSARRAHHRAGRRHRRHGADALARRGRARWAAVAVDDAARGDRRRRGADARCLPRAGFGAVPAVRGHGRRADPAVPVHRAGDGGGARRRRRRLGPGGVAAASALRLVLGAARRDRDRDRREGGR